jgi:putative oligomerization/nucleic acid binding protein
MIRKMCLSLVVLLGTLMSMTGCAWKSIPQVADYTPPKAIKYTVGVDLLNNYDTTRLDVPKIADSLKSMKVFKDVVFPYRKGDAVDAVLSLSVTEKGHENVGRDLASGALTLGLAGSKNTFTFNTIAILKSASKEVKIVNYNISTITEFSFGQLANKSEVAADARNVTCKKIAIDLANHFNDDFSRIQADLTTYQMNDSPKPAIEKKSEQQIITQNPEQQSDVAIKLKKLKQLYEAGLITQDEYNSKRTKIIEGI